MQEQRSDAGCTCMREWRRWPILMFKLVVYYFCAVLFIKLILVAPHHCPRIWTRAKCPKLREVLAHCCLTGEEMQGLVRATRVGVPANQVNGRWLALLDLSRPQMRLNALHIIINHCPSFFEAQGPQDFPR